MVKQNKAISPVVATALLLVVAVVAVVGFQTWFNTYQSGLTTQVEDQGTGTTVTVERLESGGNVYMKNGQNTDTQIDEIRVLQDGSEVTGCTTSTSFNATGNDVTNQTLSGCTLTDGETYDVVLVTAEGVISETEIAR
mgnify:CR=1 FL=1